MRKTAILSIFVVAMMLAVPFSTAVGWDDDSDTAGLSTPETVESSAPTVAKPTVATVSGYKPADDSYTVKGFVTQSATEESSNVVNTRGIYAEDKYIKWSQNAGSYRTQEYFEGLQYSSYGQPLIVEDLDINGKVRDVVFSTSSAFDAKTGEFLWTAPTNGIYQLKGPVYYNGVLFEQTTGGSPNFVAIDVYTGKIVASYSLGGMASAITLSDDGKIYVATSGGFNSGNGNVYCFDGNLQTVGSKLVLNCLWSTSSPSGNGYYVDRCCVAGDYVAFCDNKSQLQIFDRFNGVLMDTITYTDGTWMTGVFFNKDIDRIYSATNKSLYAYELDQETGKLNRNTFSVYTTGTGQNDQLTGVPSYYNGKLYIPENGGLLCLDWETLDVKWKLNGYGGNFILNTERDDGDGEVYLYSTASGMGGKSVVGLKDSNTMAIAEEVFSIPDRTSQFVFTGIALWDGGIYYTQDRGLLCAYVVTDQTAWERPAPESLSPGEMTVIIDSIKNIGVKKVSNEDPALTVKDALKKTLDMIDPKMKAKWDDRGLVQFRFDANTADNMWVYALWDDANSKWNFTKELKGTELAKDYSAIGLYYAYIDGDKIIVNSNSTPTNNVHYKTILFKDGNDMTWTHVCGTGMTKEKAVAEALKILNNPAFVVDPVDPKSVKDCLYAEFNGGWGYTGNWRNVEDSSSFRGKVWSFYKGGIPGMQMFDAYEPIKYKFTFDAGSVVFSQYWFADGIKYNELISDVLGIKGISCSMTADPTFMGLPSNSDYKWKVYTGSIDNWTEVTNLDAVATNNVRVAYEPLNGAKDTGESLDSTFLVENQVTPSMGWYSVRGAKLATLSEYVGEIILNEDSKPLSVKSIGSVANTAENIWNSWQWVSGGWAQVISLQGGSSETIYALVYGPAGSMPSYLVDTPYDKDKVLSTATGKVTVSADVEPYTYYNSTVNEVVVQDGVTSIGAYAFYGTAIKNVTLPDSVTSIGAYAFYGCPLETVKVGEKVYFVGEYAFGTDAKFLPKFQVKDLGEGKGEIVKYNGPGGEVVIPEKLGGLTVVSIGGGTFLDRADITSVTVPAAVNFIGTKAFRGTSISTMTLAADNLVVSMEAFAECPNLASITFKGTVKSIGSYAFNGCSKLAAVNFEKTVGSFGAYAFAKTAITNFTLPSNMTEVPMGLFAETATLQTVDLTGAVKIGDYAFYKTGITALTIPSTVTSIGNHSFFEVKITSLVVPKSVTYIGTHAFFGAQALEFIEFEAGRERSMSIPAKAFALKSDRENVYTGWYTEPNGAGTKWDFRVAEEGGKYYSQIIAPPTEFEEIFNYTIKGGNVSITGLKIAMAYVDVPDCLDVNGDLYPVTSIGGMANSDSLVEIKLPKYVKSIGFSAFDGCVNLVNVQFGDMITYIGDKAFRNTALEGDLLLKSIKTLGNNAFEKTNITSVTTGPYLTKIGWSVFSGCEKLTEVNFSPESSIDINGAFFGTSIKSIYIPSGSVVNKNAFSGCRTLEMVTLGDNVKGVNMGYPFKDTNVLVIRTGNGLMADGQGYSGSSSLSTVIIESVGQLKHNAFIQSKVLTEMYFFCPADVKTIGTNHAWSDFTVYYLAEYADTWVDADGNPKIPAFEKYKHKVFNGIKFMMNDNTERVFFLDDITSPRVDVMLNNDVPVREGYTFGGWFIDKECTKPFVKSDYAEFNGGVLKVYAKWNPVKYSLSFELNGGTYENAPTEYTFDGLTLGTPTKEGQQFVGWFLADDYFEQVSELPVPYLGDLKLYAAWSDTNINPFLSFSASFDGVVIDGYKGANKNVVIPAFINGKQVTKIGDRAFQNQTIESIKLPESIREIGDGAFENCKYLERIEIGGKIVSIGEKAFAGCDKLLTVQVAPGIQSPFVENGVLYFGSSAIQYLPASGIRDIVISDKCWRIASYAFYEADIDSVSKAKASIVNIGEKAFFQSKVKSVFPIQEGQEFSALGTVDDQAFAFCYELKDVSFHPNARSVENRGFYQTGVETLSLPRDMTYIGGQAFANTQLKSIDFSLCKNLREIEGIAFMSTKLTSVTIPDCVDKLGNGAFNYCSDMTSITIPDGVEIEGQVCRGCAALTEIKLPSDFKFTEDSDSFFWGCMALKTITIPEGSTVLPSSMFRTCHALESIFVPASVTDLGSMVFYDCPALKSITIAGDIKSAGYRLFSGISPEATITFLGSVDEKVQPSIWGGCPDSVKINYVPGVSDSWLMEGSPESRTVLPIDLVPQIKVTGHQVSVDIDMWAKNVPALTADVQVWVYAEFEGGAKDSSLFMRNISNSQLKDGNTETVQFSCFSEPVKISVMLFTDDPANGGVMLSETTKTL